MIFLVVLKGQPADENLSAALAGDYIARRLVYVVGVSEADALANALANKDIREIEDPDAEEVLQFKFSELIGIESPEMIAAARARVLELQGDTYLAYQSKRSSYGLPRSRH